MPHDDQTWVAINPRLRAGGRAEQVYVHAAHALSAISPVDGNGKIHDLRAMALRSAADAGAEAQAARVSLSVLYDLWAQGWTFRAEGGVVAKPPEVNRASPDLEKARLRAAHLHARDGQLRKPPIRDFVLGMERRRLGPNGWTSIFSLMRDGPEFAAKLRAAAAQSTGEPRDAVLRGCIAPYIQFVDTDSVCQFTGLRLIDIWRYFRYTWTTPQNTTPGRRMLLLVRDRAAENHPVIGIAALASAVVQHGRRDEWIGWTGDRLVETMRREFTGQWARWLDRRLHQLVRAIYCKDFLAEGVITRSDLRAPTNLAVKRLLREAARAWRQHRLYPKASEHKTATRDRGGRFWERQAKSHLFRAKRAETLAQLLCARRALLDVGFTSANKTSLLRVLETGVGRRAIAQIVRAVKAAHVGIDMMDITVCGSIAPYAPILGGKLISLLLTSPEVTQAYERRYATAESVIASSMAARAVQRRPKLVFLGTTSLYGVGSSQYNRLKVPAEQLGGEPGKVLWFQPVGHSAGYGSFHLSPDTVAEIEALISQHHKSRRVNSIFGEGVSPRLRKVREGLELIGLPADRILQHGSPRIVYAIPLATNFRDVLLGRTRRARHILPQAHSRETTKRIIAFWVRRWLSPRVERDDALKEVERHSLIHPIDHGARVRLPGGDEELPRWVPG
jgi:hypothetical protein